MLTYLDEIAQEIAEAAGDDVDPTADEMQLYRIYAVLCLAKGEATTNEDVHNAWTAWQLDVYPSHRSLIPFNALEPRVQDLDAPYTAAIRSVAQRRAATK